MWREKGENRGRRKELGKEGEKEGEGERRRRREKEGGYTNIIQINTLKDTRGEWK
jgi:hypothetical protein